jgi:ribulose-5-phosphate 4-epimerase/fuculose-1-phosphate aldolase
MDLDGNVIGRQGRFNKAGFTIHSAIYKARADANCAMHTHTRAGAGAAMLKGGLRPISQDAMQVYDELAYHEYGMPATQEECDALGVSCQKGSCVVLFNHGLLTFAPTVHGALQSLYMLERACELELISRTLGEPPVTIDEAVVAKMGSVMKKARADHRYGLHEWNALVRLIESKGGTDFRS